MSADELVKTDSIDLQISAIMAEVAAPELVGKICDALFADLKHLCEESQVRGSQRVCEYFNAAYSTKPYVSEGGWSASERGGEWYKGHYISIGLDHRGTNASLGFLTEPVVNELRRRLKEAHMRHHQPEPSSANTVGGVVNIHSIYYHTPSGVYELTHTHSWYFGRRL